jgi:hypothetical protein
MLCGGAASFLVTLVAVHTAEIGWRGAGMLQRWTAIAALLALVWVGRGWPPALLVGSVFAVLVATIVFDVVRLQACSSKYRRRFCQPEWQKWSVSCRFH